MKGDTASPWLSFSEHILLEPSHHPLRKPKPLGEAVYSPEGQASQLTDSRLIILTIIKWAEIHLR